MDCLYGEVVKGVGRGCFTFPAAIRGAMGCLYGGVMQEGRRGRGASPAQLPSEKQLLSRR